LEEATLLHRDRYHASELIYVAEVHPQSLADIIIDNRDPPIRKSPRDRSYEGASKAENMGQLASSSRYSLLLSALVSCWLEFWKRPPPSSSAPDTRRTGPGKPAQRYPRPAVRLAFPSGAGQRCRAQRGWRW